MEEKHEKHTGTVGSWRGTHGFIVPSEGGYNVFVHHSDLLMEGYRELHEGDLVEYEMGSSDRGVKAILVKVIKPAAESAA